jgi:multidrug efflux pump subunit AcrB
VRKNTSGASANLAQRIVALFINSKITPLLAIVAILIGVVSIASLPREEEPQINVTTIDLFVDLPATPSREVEQRACRPLEKLLRELPGVEYVYSTSSENRCLVSLRFFVGYSAEQAIVEANSKVNANLDVLPSGASKPLIKVRSIDDVPILTLTFWSEKHDHYMLRRIAAQLDEEVKGIHEVSETRLFGGQKREVRVYPDRAAMHVHNIMLADMFYALKQANYPMTGGEFKTADAEIKVDSIATFGSAEDVGNTQIKNYDSIIIAAPRSPIRLKDIARIEDGPGEPDNYVYFSYGQGGPHGDGKVGNVQPSAFYPAVTLSIAKLPGTSASAVAQRVMAKLEAQKGRTIPDDVHVEITRDYGHTATEKSNELLFHMGIAVISVTLLIALSLGWRESLVVAVAIPVTLALTLSAFYFMGYTLNRITLFALIFSIGILVDDPIVDVENIVRHLRKPENKGRSTTSVVIEAVNEVRSPLILATLAVIVAILPMALVSGLMGPYMRPIPVGASLAMLISMVVAFVFTPWVAARVLKHAAIEHGDRISGHASGQLAVFVRRMLEQVRNKLRPLSEKLARITQRIMGTGSGDEERGGESRLTRAYRQTMALLLSRLHYQFLFLGVVSVLLIGSVLLIPTGGVKVKMLPFDNKNEFQVIVDMPEGTPLERTESVARELARTITQFDQVRDVQVYAGVASPFNFNGLIRHYYLRGSSADADLQVNLIDRHDRKEQSHDIAKKVRAAIQPIADRHAARVKVAEVPPGPPVLQTLVAEVYGPDEAGRIQLVKEIEAIFRETGGVVDVDNCLVHDQRKVIFKVDPDKAALNHIDPEMCSQNLNIGLNGRVAGVLHDPREREQVDIRIQLPEAERSSVDDILSLPVRGRDLRFIPLGEMMSVSSTVIDQQINHKNLMPVSYVLADVAGSIESPIYAIQAVGDKIKALKPNAGSEPGLDIYFASQPLNDTRYAIKWDGEMHVTYEVFRDLGLAFAGVLVLIYILMVAWFDSYKVPLIIMAVIPYSLIGILPAHALMGSFFSATSMIGFIAGAGIVVRNSIILVDFINLRMSQGMPLREAVIDAGAVRFRPMVLTASAVVVGSAVILFDPIFQGLALSLMAGEIASLLIGRAAVPILFFMTYKPAKLY